MRNLRLNKPDNAQLEAGVTLIGIHDQTRGSVMFVVSYNGPSEPAVAFRINKRLPAVFLSDILPDISPDHDAVVYDGGDAGYNTLHVVHTDNFGIGQKRVGPVMWGGNYTIVQQRVNSGTLVASQAKLFIGYNELPAGELDKQIAAEWWHVERAPAEVILSQKDPYKQLLLDTGTNWGKVMANHPRDVLSN